MKIVTGEAGAFIRNLQSAINQLGGTTGESPPSGFQRIADIRIQGENSSLRFASRTQLLEVLRGQLDHLERLTPAGAAPGLVRITNAISTFFFTSDELR